MTLQVSVFGILIDNRFYKVCFDTISDDDDQMIAGYPAKFKELLSMCDFCVNMMTHDIVKFRYGGINPPQTITESNPLYNIIAYLPLLTVQDVLNTEHTLSNAAATKVGYNG